MSEPKIKLYALDVSVNFTGFLANRVKSLCGKRKVNIVFPNIRPLRFVEKKLDLQCILNCNFYSMPDLVREIVLNHSEEVPVFQEEIERLLTVLNILKKNKDLYMKLGGDDSSVFPWVRRLSSLFGEIDRQLIESVKDFEYFDNTVKQAREILNNLERLYSQYRKEVEEKNITFGGDSYKRAVRILEKDGFFADKKGEIFFFCGFSYLSESEKRIILSIADKLDCEIYFQADLENRHLIGDKRFNAYEIYNDWFSGKFWGVKPEELKSTRRFPSISFYEAYDVHSEVRLFSDTLLKVMEKEGEKAFSNPEKVGIVLADSSTLFPLLFYFPEGENIRKNITMGFPFEKTGLGDFLSRLFKLLVDMERENGARIYVPLFLKVIKSELISLLAIGARREDLSYLYSYFLENDILFIDTKYPELSVEDKTVLEITKAIINKVVLPFSQARNLTDLKNAFGKLYSMLNKDVLSEDKYLYERIVLQSFYSKVVDKLASAHSFAGKEITFNARLFYSVITVLSKNISVPFEGNPLKGMQIMGTLEARSLSFDYLFILDVNEGILPSSEKIDPLMPEVLKTELGLSGFREREKLFRYNFFRLVDSSKNVFVFYKSGQTSDEKKVRSRFVEQLIFEKQIREEKEKFDYDENFITKSSVSLGAGKGSKEKGIEKEQWMQQKIEHFFKRGISPTLIDDYLSCPYMFYLKRIAGIGEKSELSEGQRADRVGSLIHKLLEKGFEEYKGRVLDDELLTSIRKKVNSAFKNFVKNGSFNEFSVNDDEKEEIFLLSKYFKNLESGRKDILYEVGKYRLNALFDFFDKQIKENKEQILLVDFEKTIEVEDEFFINREPFSVNFRGIIDRIEEVSKGNGKFTRIIDYKTGAYAKTPPYKIKDLVDEELQDYNDKEVEMLKAHINSVQLPLYVYTYALLEEKNPEEIVSVLYLLGQSGKVEREFVWEKVFSKNDEFRHILKLVFSHMLLSEKLFATPGDSCKFCNYAHFCKYSI